MTRRRLDRELVRRGLAASTDDARRMLQGGGFTVHGIPTPKPASLVAASTPIEPVDAGPGYVGRGALKLEGALDVFGIDVTGVRALDVGASTGGFTQVLLRRGASAVTALDVGRGQLDHRLRGEERVTVMERTNLRYTRPEDTGGTFELIVGDLSFISLCTVASALADLAGPGADLVLLIKPQFEAEPHEVGRGGVVREESARVRVVSEVVACLDGHGLGALALCASPIAGAGGNREVFAWCRAGAAAVPDLEVPA